MAGTSDLKFIKTQTNQVQAEIHQGPILHQTTGPADVFKMSMVEHKSENLKKEFYNPFYDESSRQSSRD